MSDIVLLSESDLRAHVPLDLDAVDCVQQAFAALAEGAAVMPPVLRLDLPAHHGEVDVKTAWLPALDQFAIKISPGFFDNPALGLPSLNGLMVVLSARTGLTEALLLDNGYLTAVRTAAAGAVAARWLAREDARHAAILGAGEQARLQLQALTLVRPIATATVWARRADAAQRYAADMTAQLGISVQACDSVTAALQDADVAVTATPSTTPLIEPEHLHPGLHLTAMGADAPHKNEVAPAALAAATRVVCDRLAQAREMGELRHATTPRTDVVELGAIIAGSATGRATPADVTLCDLTGTGAQDTAIAVHALARLRRADPDAGTATTEENDHAQRR